MAQLRGCELTSWVVCINDKFCDIRERNVTIRSEVWTTNIQSLGSQDTRECVTLWRLILRSLGWYYGVYTLFHLIRVIISFNLWSGVCWFAYKTFHVGRVFGACSESSVEVGTKSIPHISSLGVKHILAPWVWPTMNPFGNVLCSSRLHTASKHAP